MRSFILLLVLTAVLGTIAAPLEKRAPAKVYTSCVKPKTLALTFDDGPYQYTYDLATFLRKKGVKATFFINGNNYENVETDTTPDGKSYMKVLKHIYDSGHMIASHTYNHRNLVSLSDADVRKEMTKNSDVIYRAIKRRPAFMRPPEGAYDARVLKILGDLKYKVVMWDIDTLDWSTHNLKKEQKNYKDAFAKDSKGGHIALQHDTYEQTVKELTPWVVDYVKSKGYRFVTVAECLGFSSAYQ